MRSPDPAPGARRSRPLLRTGVVSLTATLLVVAPATMGPAAAEPPVDAVAAAASTSAVTAAVTAGRAAPARVVPKIAWRSCGSSARLRPFQCATVRVPLDYDQPDGSTTKLALTRLPAADPARRIGTLFTNPGGPGGSGVDFVQAGARVLYTQSVRDRFDILGFDPRGVSRSAPATCFRSAAAEQRALARLPFFPQGAREVAAFKKANRALAEQCAKTSPGRFDHDSTANVARDMDLLRRAVGDAKLSYAGYSYGTVLGATYAALFPTHIRAMAVDGTIDPREWSGTASRFAGVPIGNRIEQDRGGQEVFAQLLERCRLAGPARCSLASVGNPASVARLTFRSLKTKPARVRLPDGSAVRVTYQQAVASIFPELYGVASWPDVADFLTVLSQATKVTSSSIATPRASRGVAKLLRPVRGPLAARGANYDSIGGALASLCVETRSATPASYRRAANQADTAFGDFGRYRTWTDLPCSYLKGAGIADRDAYTGPWTQRTNTPVLVLGTRHDPATPYKNTRPYAGLFRRATVVTLGGWGHTTLGQSTCTDAQVTSYLLAPNAARADVTCKTDLKPFAATTAAARERQRQAALALGAVAGSLR